MAVLYITEYTAQGSDLNAHEMPVAQLPVNAQQTVAVSASSASSVVFQNNTGLVRLHTDTVLSMIVAAATSGTTLVATTTNARMAANQTEYFAVPRGSAYLVAAIANS
jgi:hypothetical protein